MPSGARNITDSCVHYGWAAQRELVEYLPAAWQEYVGSGDLAWGLGAKDIGLQLPYLRPHGHESSGVTLASRDDFCARMRTAGVGTAVLVPGQGYFLPADNNPHMARELTTAHNRWTAERWLEDDDSPYLGSILVPNQMPELAAAEIRRYAAHPKMVQVVLGANGLGKPFGHPAYHPILAAAAENGLPVVIHSMGDGLSDTLAHGTAGGLSAMYGEYRALGAQSLMTHAISLISQGVFDEYADLRVLLLGGGVSWIAPFLWRVETNFGAFGRESPWLKHTPTAYFVEHIRVGTHRLERPRDLTLFEKSVGRVEATGALLCYASGSPAGDADTVSDVCRLLPPDWHDAVLHGTSAQLYRNRLSVARDGDAMQTHPPRT